MGAIVASEDEDVGVDGISVTVTALNELIGEIAYHLFTSFFGTRPQEQHVGFVS